MHHYPHPTINGVCYKQFATFVTMVLTTLSTYARVADNTHTPGLHIAPGTLTAHSVTLIWNRLSDLNENAMYQLSVNGKLIAETRKSYYLINNLTSSARYKVEVAYKGSIRSRSKTRQIMQFMTPQSGKVINVKTYGASGNGISLDTKSIQRAIDVCDDGDVVLLPPGTYLSGAVFLKSNMTLTLAKGAVLKGSTKVEDYEPLIWNRFEGWEMKTCSSLINAGIMDKRGSISAQNITINGEGKISGGGAALATEMIAKYGMRGRGRLICFLNCSNVAIQGLKIERSPCWTIHYIYSKNITCQDLNISSEVENGDGIDPDSSTDCYILGCRFSTGDDCIAIKSGKNPEGNLLAKPTENVRITDCDFIRGHGLSIGSEMSGGVRNISVNNCRAGALLYGLQIKTTKDRGGYVEQVEVSNCDLQKITVLTQLPYNNDGEAASQLPVFKNFNFTNINMLSAPPGKVLIDLNGFPDTAHFTTNLHFKNIKLPKDAKVKINFCRDLTWKNVLTADRKKPIFIENN